jgi:uncharacterized repeat protein (TIGR01451 family)
MNGTNMRKYLTCWLLTGLIFNIVYSQTINNQATSQYNTPTGSGESGSNTVTVVVDDVPPSDVALFKTSSPPSATSVLPGSPLTYTLRFPGASTSLDRDVINLVLVDSFDPNYRFLNARVLVDGNEQPGASRFDATTSTLTVSLAEFAAGSSLEVTVRGFVRSSAPAGVSLVNQATISWNELDGSPSGPVDSNIVNHPVNQPTPPTPPEPPVIIPCAVTLGADGTVTNPGQVANAELADTVTFAYTLTNPTTATHIYLLEAVIDAASTLPGVNPNDISVFFDANQNGVVDANETTFSVLRVPVSQSFQLLVQVQLPESIPNDLLPDEGSASLFVNLVATCGDNPRVSDGNNISEIIVSELLAEDPILTKTASPASGTPLEPNTPVTYTLQLEVGSLDLPNVILQDTLDPLLSAPELLEVRIDGIVFEDADINFDASTREVTASLELAPAGSTVEFVIGTRILVDAPAGLTINNRANGIWDDGGGSADSNTTDHEVLPVCTVLVEADGTLDSPAFSVTALPGDEIVFPYTITNTGNATFSLDVTAQLLTTVSTLETSSVVSLVVLDINGNGQRDPEDVPINSLELAPGANANILLVVALPDDPSLAGDLFVNPLAACPDDASQDDDNISLVSVPEGGITDPEKTALPEDGESVVAGQGITYSIRFTNRGRELETVTLRDILDARLEAPLPVSERVRVFVNDEPVTAQVGFDEMSRELSVRLANLAANASVRVEVDTRVQVGADTTLGPIDNIACVTATGPAVSSDESCTNEVSHPLELLELLIIKEADRTTVQLGDSFRYTITVTNPSASVTLDSLELRDSLPAGLRYIAGSSLITLPNGSQEATEPSSEMPLVWMLPSLAPRAEITVQFDVLVLASALNALDDNPVDTGDNSNDDNENGDKGRLVNIAEVRAISQGGEVLAVREDDAVVVLEQGVFAGRPVLLGTAYIDRDGDGRLSAGDDPVEGLRVYLPDGASTVTDPFGHYTFLDIPSGLTSLKVDPETLPNRPLQDTITQERPGLWRLRLFEGTITRQDIPFVADDSGVDVTETINVTRGPVRLTKTVSRRPNRDALGNVIEDELVVTVTLELRNSGADSLPEVVIRDTLPLGISLTQNPEGRRDTEAVSGADELVFELAVLTTTPVTFGYEYIDPEAIIDISVPTLLWRLP